MEDKKLKLIYPQWQGGKIDQFFKDVDEKQISQGYYLGSYILDVITNLINPSLSEKSEVVPIGLGYQLDNGQRYVQDGIIDKYILVEQTKAALDIIEKHNPNKILVLGGECSICVAPFMYLANKYKDEIGLIYFDAHPDVGVPYDEYYMGYHAMTVSAFINKGNLKEIFNLPASLPPSSVLVAGLNSDEAIHYKKRLEEYNVSTISGIELNKSITPVIDWVKKYNFKKLLIHIDLDVLNKDELYVAVGNTGIVHIETLLTLINSLEDICEIVGLAIAEHMPKTQVVLKSILEKLPLIKKKI